MGIRNHFECSNIFLQHDEPSDFYRSTCSCLRPITFTIIRMILAIYSITMLVLNVVYEIHSSSNPFMWTGMFGNWNYIVATLYFTMVFVITGTESLSVHTPRRTKVGILDDEYELSMKNINSVDTTPSSSKANIVSNDQTQQQHYLSYSNFSKRKRRRKLLQQKNLIQPKMLDTACKVVWIFHNIAFTSTIIAIIWYWTYVHIYNDKLDMDIPTYVLIDSHGINLLLLMIDMYLGKIPFKVLHFIHPLIFTILYGIYYYIFTKLTNDAVYTILDWNNSPFETAGIFIAALLLAIFIHCAMCVTNFVMHSVDRKAKIGFVIVSFCLVFVFFLVVALFI